MDRAIKERLTVSCIKAIELRLPPVFHGGEGNIRAKANDFGGGKYHWNMGGLGSRDYVVLP